MARAQFDALFQRVNNTGRWGARDEQGTLNLITPEARRLAAAEVRDGGTVSLAREYVAGPQPGVFEPMLLDFMQVSDSMIGPADGSVLWTAERVGLIYHGWAFTHVDALAHMRGAPYLPPNAPVTVADLEAWEQQAGLRVRSGDVLLIRTGHWARASAPDSAAVAQGLPGIHPEVALWLHERGVAALGADLNESVPSPVAGLTSPLPVRGEGTV
jgi:hypothetical protein